jgi:hypothetical protein
MRLPRLRRPSPALVIALLALVAALGGTAYAVKQINGATIRKRSIPGDRIRNNGLTGTQIDESRLGRVPEARNATNSKFALRASAADSSANALNAGNASTLGGNPPGVFQTRVRWAQVDAVGTVGAQSGGISASSSGGGAYVVDFGASVLGRAIVVTPSGTTPRSAAATPTDANHVQVTLSAAGGFYIAVIS